METTRGAYSLFSHDVRCTIVLLVTWTTMWFGRGSRTLTLIVDVVCVQPYPRSPMAQLMFHRDLTNQIAHTNRYWTDQNLFTIFRRGCVQTIRALLESVFVCAPCL